MKPPRDGAWQVDVPSRNETTEHLQTRSGRDQSGAFDSELTIVEAARLGDSAAFADLFRRYRPRVFGLARRYFAPRTDRDDLIQEATIGFYKAVRDFKGQRGAFPAFVELCVRRQIITFIKTATRQKHAALNWAASIDAPVFMDSDESLATRLTGSEGPDFAELSETTAFLSKLWERCSGLERGVLSLYTKGYTFAEMGYELGVRLKSIDNAVWRVKVKARKLLNEQEYQSLSVRYAWRTNSAG